MTTQIQSFNSNLQFLGLDEFRNHTWIGCSSLHNHIIFTPSIENNQNQTHKGPVFGHVFGIDFRNIPVVIVWDFYLADVLQQRAGTRLYFGVCFLGFSLLN